MFLKRLITFDLGETIWTRQKVWVEIQQRFPATMELSVAALLISCTLGVIFGIISATKQYSIFDYLSMLGALAGVSMPIFWLGLVFMLIFSDNLGWLPISGRLSVGVNLEVITNFYILDAIIDTNWEALGDALWHLIMPAFTLSTIPTAIVAPASSRAHSSGFPAGPRCSTGPHIAPSLSRTTRRRRLSSKRRFAWASATPTFTTISRAPAPSRWTTPRPSTGSRSRSPPGTATGTGWERDPDLAGVRSHPEYAKLLQETTR